MGWSTGGLVRIAFQAAQRHPPLEDDRKLVDRAPPVLDRHRPTLADVPQPQVQQLEHRLVAGEQRAVLAEGMCNLRCIAFLNWGAAFAIAAAVKKPGSEIVKLQRLWSYVCFFKRRLYTPSPYVAVAGVKLQAHDSYYLRSPEETNTGVHLNPSPFHPNGLGNSPSSHRRFTVPFIGVSP